MSDIPAGQSPGPSTDRHNDPVIDPTKNVLDLVDQAIQRQDDLRAMEAKHLREMIEIRSQHTKEMRKSEADRLDAIRAVDVAAVIQQAAAAETRATALAGQVAASAEAMRNQVAAAATAAQTSLAAALEPVQKDIADLRRAQYEAQGQKTQVVEQRGGTGQTLAMAAIVLSALAIIVTIAIAIVLSSNP